MVLNLGIRNIALSLPTLLDQWRKGPFEVKRINIDTTIKGIANRSNKDIDTNRSKKRFI
tara:strand:+ start:626 stop:802 length:177 start_codon:yes stop_codon:yes gene_type:complete